jgi:16S rRNA (guanine966-N2)-methyltransferase
MRVISGSARGLKLKAPDGLETRPTTDRIKESLFNIIASDLYEADFLDIFSGSGGIGIEALSRGAASAVFIDSSRKSINVINDNVNAAKVSQRAEILNMDMQKALTFLKGKGKTFDIIFMDPPYSKGLTEKALEITDRFKLLKSNGYIIAEQSVDENIDYTGSFEIFRIKDYKRTTKMTFLRWRNVN